MSPLHAKVAFKWSLSSVCSLYVKYKYWIIEKWVACMEKFRTKLPIITMCTSRYGFRQNAASQTLKVKRTNEQTNIECKLMQWSDLMLIPNCINKWKWKGKGLMHYTLDHTYSPYRQMVLHYCVVSYAHNSCWLQIVQNKKIKRKPESQCENLYINEKTS